MISIVKKDLVKAFQDQEIDGLLQQCNCMTKSGRGLSEQIEKTFPWVTVYSSSIHKKIPGTFSKYSHHNQDIYCLFGQWRPGKFGSAYWNKYPESIPVENPQQRLVWFDQGLNQILKEITQKQNQNQNQKQDQKNSSNVYHLGIPFNIGCGLAGGYWPDYWSVLEKYAKLYSNNIKIILYKI